MKVVVTGAEGPLGQAAGRALAAAGHQAAPLAGDPRDPEAAAAALAGAGALLHLAPLGAPPPGAPPAAAGEYLDGATRGTYVLLRAAAAAGVGRVVLGSTLALLERYPAAWAVSEAWRPRPDPAAPAQLGAFLAEASAREIARAEPLQVVCLRLGLVVGAEAEAAGAP
jgi:nucleoside-diphosphate-sugar epimerase